MIDKWQVTLMIPLILFHSSVEKREVFRMMPQLGSDPIIYWGQILQYAADPGDTANIFFAVVALEFEAVELRCLENENRSLCMPSKLLPPLYTFCFFLPASLSRARAIRTYPTQIGAWIGRRHLG